MSDWGLIGILATLGLGACIFLIYPLKVKRLVSIALVPIILVLVASGYVVWGGFDQWQIYQQQLESQKQAKKMLRSIKSPDELITKLKQKLDNTPKSAKGWYLLGRLYVNQNDFTQATEAFAKAYKLAPDNEQYVVNYIHGLWKLNNQQFNSRILGLLKDLLDHSPNQPDALAMLAMNSFLSHDYEGAINYWQRLLKLTAPQSEEASAIHKAITKAQERINLTREDKND
jgi:cytochrome c-type biogenesis protein CcmH/NrfG